MSHQVIIHIYLLYTTKTFDDKQVTIEQCKAFSSIANNECSRVKRTKNRAKEKSILMSNKGDDTRRTMAVILTVVIGLVLGFIIKRVTVGLLIGLALGLLLSGLIRKK